MDGQGSLKDVKPVEWKDPEDEPGLPTTPEMGSTFEQDAPQAPPVDLSPVPFAPEVPDLPGGMFDPVSTEDFKGEFSEIVNPQVDRRRALRAQQRSRQEDRIRIRSGQAPRNEVLAGIERRAMAVGATAVLPEEFDSEAPSPFEWNGSDGQRRSGDFVTPSAGGPRGNDFVTGGAPPRPRRPEEVAALDEIARAEPTRQVPQQFSNPFESNTSEVITLLRLISEQLKQINEKLPVVATFSE